MLISVTLTAEFVNGFVFSYHSRPTGVSRVNPGSPRYLFSDTLNPEIVYDRLDDALRRFRVGKVAALRDEAGSGRRNGHLRAEARSRHRGLN